MVKAKQEETSKRLEFQDNRAYLLEGDRKVKRTYVNRKRRFLLIFEGESSNLFTGASLVKKDVDHVSSVLAEASGKSVEEVTELINSIRTIPWAVDAEKGANPSSEPTLEKIEN